jgi:hypothetical protein
MRYNVGDILQRSLTNNYDLKSPQTCRVEIADHAKNYYLLRNLQTNLYEDGPWASENLDLYFRRIEKTRTV